MDLVVKYTLFNIGDVAAVDVSLTEHGFGMDDFDVVGGQSAVKIDRLAGGANTTHALVLRPKKFGYFNFTSAEVKYRYDNLYLNAILLQFFEDNHGIS